METKQRKPRVEWDDGELKQVAMAMTQAYIAHPEWTLLQMAEAGQSKLHPSRRRVINGFAQAKPLLDLIRQKLAVMQALAMQADPEFGLVLPDTEAEKAALLKRATEAEEQIKQLQDQLAEIKNQPKIDPNSYLEQAPTEVLIRMLLGRLLGFVGSERSKIETNLASVLSSQVMGGAYGVADRLQRIEAKLAGNNGHLPTAPADPSESETAYMPLVAIVGIARQDFQRLQQSMMKVGVRLLKVDVSNEQKISVPQHDLLVFWARHVPEPIRQSLAMRYTNAFTFQGTLGEMTNYIAHWVKDFRKNRQTKDE